MTNPFRPRLFLPGLLQAATPVPGIDPQLSPIATPGNGPIAGFTNNFDLNLVNFDWVTWHNYEWENWVAVDALLNVAIGFLNIKGFWRPSTDYITGQSVFDPRDPTKLFTCVQTHTSGTDPVQLDDTNLWELKTQATPPVESVFGRSGNVTAQPADYEAFYFRQTNNVLHGNFTIDRANEQRFARESPAGVFTTTVRMKASTDIFDLTVFDSGGLNPENYRFKRTAAQTTQDVMRRGDSDGRYLQLTGGTLTGNLNILGIANITNSVYDKLQMVRGTRSWVFGMPDNTDPLEVVLITNSVPAQAARFDPAGATVPNALTLITREKGDGRYAQLVGASGQVLQATLVIDASALSVLTTLQMRARASDQIQEMSFRRNDGAVTDRWDIRVQHNTGNPLLTFRPNGVTTASFFGSGFASFTGAMQSVGIINLGGDTQQRTDANPSISFRNAAGIMHALIYQNRAGGGANAPGRTTFNLYDADGTNGRIIGQFEDRIANGGSLVSPHSIITREYGDTRYLQLTGDFASVNRGFAGDINDVALVAPANGDARDTRLQTGATGSAPAGAPIQNGSWLRSKRWDGNAVYQEYDHITQIAGIPRRYVRNRSSGVWSDWHQMILANANTLYVDDLNGIITNGIITADTNFATNTPLGAPGGFLIVETFIAANTSNSALQRATYVSLNRTFVRERAGAVWSAWREIEAGLPTAGEIAAANLPTGGTSADLIGIPDWANHIEVTVSLAGSTANGSLSLRIGNANGFLTSGYNGIAHRNTTTPAITGTVETTLLPFAWALNAANNYTGKLKLTRYSGNIWLFDAQGFDGPGNIYLASGRVSAGAEVVDRVQIRTSGGTINQGGAGVRFWR